MHKFNNLFICKLWLIRRPNTSEKTLILSTKTLLVPKDFFFFYSQVKSKGKKFTAFFEHSLFRAFLVKNLTNYNIVEKNINANTLLKDTYIYTFMRDLAGGNKRKFKILYLNEVIELFFVSFRTKVISGIIQWIKSYIQKAHFKKHKILISFIKFIIKNLIWKNNFFLKILGIRYFFKGKIGRGGSVRKSKISLRLGKISYSEKSIRLVQKKSTIWTKSGVVGFGLELFYNWLNLHFLLYIWFYILLILY